MCGRSNRSPWAYVLPCVQDECWDIRRGKLLWLSPCLWWRRIPHEDLDEGDHVHEDHDHPWSASGSEDCLVMFSSFPLYNLFVFRALFGLYSVAASFLCGVARPCVSLCSKPVLLKKRRKSSFHLLLCQILPCRIACILVLACASGTARPLGRAPRSFRNCFSLRNPRRLQCYLVNSRDVHDESSWFVALHTYWHLR